VFAGRMGQNNSWNSSSLGFLRVRTSLSVGRRKHYKVGKDSLTLWDVLQVWDDVYLRWKEADETEHEICWVHTVWQEIKVNEALWSVRMALHTAAAAHLFAVFLSHHVEIWIFVSSHFYTWCRVCLSDSINVLMWIIWVSWMCLVVTFLDF